MGKNMAELTKDSYKVRKIRGIAWLCVLLGLILAGYFFSGSAVSLYNRYFVNNHQQVAAYLDNVQLISDDSDMILDNVRLKLYYLDEDVYLGLVHDGEKEIQERIAQFKTSKPPAGFHQHQKAFLSEMDQKLTILANYEKTKKTYKFDELNQSINVLEHRQQIERNSLLKAFKTDGIQYKQLGDGTVRFWYKNHSGKSIGGLH